MGDNDPESVARLFLDDNGAKILDGAKQAFAMAEKLDNPIINSTVEVIKNCLSFGSQIPYLGPICSILTFIVQIEAGAREAEAKCGALMERMNFMMEHVSVLQNVKLIAATEKVLKRMLDVVKESAAVIQAYRKQGKIARRLNTSNKDKFLSCSASIESCAHDLMFSLQIHQTSKLQDFGSILEPEDEEAERFVASHGGFDNIKNDPEAIKVFAAQMKLTMDDNVMIELNTNIANLMKENQEALENVLKNNVGSAVMEGFEQIANQIRELENEEQFLCVQCGLKYKESKNSLGSCSFHSQSNTYNGDYSCCDSKTPCTHKTHRKAHHCDYPYEKFFLRVYSIVRYTDTMDEWSQIEDRSLEDDQEFLQIARAGKLLSNAGFVMEVPYMVIQIGPIKQSGPNFFMTFSTKDLQEFSLDVQNTNNTLIHQSSDKDGQSRAEWILNAQGQIHGIILSVQSKTSTNPTTESVLFNPDTFDMISKRLISSAVYAFKPDGQYILPASQQVGRSLTDTPARKIRKFKTKGALKRSLLLSISSDPPWKANPDYARQDQDSFFGKLTIFNKTKEPIVIMSIDSDYRLIGDKEYVNTESCKPEPNLPITVEPLKSVEVSLCIEVLRSDKMADLKLKWWGRALVARDRPIRFRIRVSDMEEEEGYLVTEFVNVNHQPTKKSDDSLAFFYLDDFDRLLRFNVEVEYDTQLTVKNLGIYLSPERMHMIAYKAIKAGISEYALDVEVSSSVEQFQAQVWALIDFKCRRIYALKILMRPKDEYPQTSAVLGYVLCPDYGNNGELRSISMAQETVQFPTLEPETRMEYEQDDTFDDEVVDNPASLISAVVTNSSKIISDAVDTHASVQQGIQNIGSFDQLGIVLESKLTSIDVKLERTVTALERTANAIEGLAAMLKTLALHQSKEQ